MKVQIAYIVSTMLDPVQRALMKETFVQEFGPENPTIQILEVALDPHLIMNSLNQVDYDFLIAVYERDSRSYHMPDFQAMHEIMASQAANDAPVHIIVASAYSPNVPTRNGFIHLTGLGKKSVLSTVRSVLEEAKFFAAPDEAAKEDDEVPMPPSGVKQPAPPDFFTAFEELKTGMLFSLKDSKDLYIKVSRKRGAPIDMNYVENRRKFDGFTMVRIHTEAISEREKKIVSHILASIWERKQMKRLRALSKVTY